MCMVRCNILLLLACCYTFVEWVNNLYKYIVFSILQPVNPSVTPGIVVLESLYTILLYFLPILVLPAVYIR